MGFNTDLDTEALESQREAGPSGVNIQNIDRNIALQQSRAISHDCEGSRCICQRYENGELAVVVMNQNRGQNQEWEDVYQNVRRGRNFQNRSGCCNPNHPNLNPNYQNPVDLVRTPGRQHEPEENIYERLDNDEDESDNVEVGSDENLERFQNSIDNHTYERINNRPWYRNYIESRDLSQYDQPRNFYFEASRNMRSQFCPYRMNRLGRNCFSTENIAIASYRRHIYQSGRNCTCPFCRHLCHQCFNLHDRLRYQDSGHTVSFANSRHYIYQVSRNCRCSFCRGDSPCSRFPLSSNRIEEYLRRECQCRDPVNCTCGNRFFSNSNSAIYVGRLDFEQLMNTHLYASPSIYIGRMERSLVANLTVSSGSSSNASTESSGSSGNASAYNELRSAMNRPLSQNNPSTSSVRCQHTCDDSCIRNQGGSVSANVCQFLGRCERTDCQHGGRVSVHWWFINKWLPSWGFQNSDRSADRSTERNTETFQGEGGPSEQQQDSDSEEPERLGYNYSAN